MSISNNIEMPGTIYLLVCLINQFIHLSRIIGLYIILQPMSWQQPYVPVLARGMLDFLMAPTAFLMGCHSSHFEEVAAVSTY